ncbi:response regulator [Hydrogenophaga sp. ANAO-22]|jgi:DNA-binding NarL/FixJ family response regulator|uniref:response regulator n=1 Tax=Hydrogenophaga sp. ANAO-22 TaxID=3166645 RepID=UPI0036D33B40
MWRVLIVEDDPEMRSFFESCVARSPALALAGCVGTVAHARDCLARPGEGVDVLLTDLGLPDGSGLEVIRQARLTHPDCETLVISMFGDEDNVLASIEAGALGYIHKDAAPEDIAQTILEMKAGGSPISPMIARRVLTKYAARQAAVPPPAAAPPPVERPPLSRREQEVLGLIARGFSYQEIANLQGVSVHTVQAHIKSLYSKLAVHSKMEAVFEATRMGMLPRHD